MSNTFRRLTRPTLILASPFDVQYLRELTERLHAGFIRAQNNPDTVGLFAWERVTRELPFDDRLPAQAQLPSPQDPLCRGVIAFFGEWIGRELPPDFDKTPIAPLGADNENQAYRLVHPWRDGAEESGGFPLTGSTFEVLTTIATLNEPGQTDAPPLLLLFVGPPDVAKESHAPNARWGNSRLRDRVVADYQKLVSGYSGSVDIGHAQRAFAEMHRTRECIDSHLAKLRNFYCYLNTVRAHVSKTVANEAEAGKAIEWFLHEVIGANESDTTVENAFKGLGFFDIQDSAVYYGRDSSVKPTLERIEALWHHPDAIHLHWVRGPSGSGKSSFLRAGLIGNTAAARYFGKNCSRLVVRPNQLDGSAIAHPAREQHWPLRRLLCHCLAAIRNTGIDDLLLAAELAAFDAANEPVGWAVDALFHALGTADGGVGRRLLLGLDQFEEIVDLLADRQHGPAWHDVVSFVLRVAELPPVMVIATMRDDRSDAMRHHRELEANYQTTKGTSQPLGLPTGEEMAEIIRKPLSRIRDLIVEPDLIQRLVDRVRAFSWQENGTRDSCLPLIGLTLQRLYREVARPLIADYRNFGDRAAPATLSESDDDPTNQFQSVAKADAGIQSGARLTVAIAENHNGSNFLDVAGAIEILAEEAVQATKDEVGPNWDDLEIAGVLRRLVSWASSADQRFSLPAVAWPKRGVARTLTAALKQRRLVVDEDGGRIRLVHEAVVENWSAAKSWLDFELPLLVDVPVLLGMARKWQDHARPGSGIELPPFYHAPAVRLLALWFELFNEIDPAHDPDHKGVLRDFCLGVLRTHGRASSLVEGTPRQPTHFMLAVSYAQLDIARRMLDEESEVVNLARADGRTPIYFPAFENDVEMLDLLLRKGARVNVEDVDGWRPIHAAAVRGALDAGRRLVDAGARLDGEGAPGGTTPLQLAASEGHLDFIHYLVHDRRVDVDAMNNVGQTALFSSLSDNHVSALKALLALGARKETTVFEGTDKNIGWSLLHTAANSGFAGAVEVLLDEGLDGNLELANGFTALHLAAQEGHAKVVRILASHLTANGMPVDAPAFDAWAESAARLQAMRAARETTAPHRDNAKFDMTPLHLAVMNNHLDAVRVLLDYADVNATTGAGATPLHIAATSQRDDAARLLMWARPDIHKRDASGRTPLQLAVSTGSWSVARALIEGGVALDQCTRETIGGAVFDLSPLHLAVAEGNWPAAQFYLRHAQCPVDIVNLRGHFGRTPLHLAALADATDMARLFLDESAEALALDDDGMSAAHYAARRGSHATLGTLLRDHPEPLRASAGGVPTPLHLAAYSGNGNAVERLLADGWMNDLPDASGLSPFHRAVQAGALDCVRALAAAGAAIAAPTRDGRFTALNFAAETGDEEVLAWLLDAGGVRPDLTAPAGEPPLVTAMRYHRHGFAALLLGAGAHADVIAPATGRSLRELYERSIEDGDARRHEGLEHALTRAGILPARAFPATNRAVAYTVTPRPARAVRAEYNPGATGFALQDLPNGETTVWSIVTDEELGRFLASLSPIDGKWPVEPGSTRVRWRKLPWYDDVALIRLQNAELDAQNLGIFFLSCRGDLFRLNGRSTAIHEVNAKAPIRLTPQNTLDYLRFFCYFVHGDKGPFYLAEDSTDPLLPQFRDETAKSVLAGTVRPATLEGIDERGRYVCETVICYSTALFHARFAVYPNGLIEMLHDEPIAADLPGQIDARLS